MWKRIIKIFEITSFPPAQLRLGGGTVTPSSLIRAISQSVLSEEPDSLIKEPDFKIIYKFLIKDKGQNLIKQKGLILIRDLNKIFLD
jgi:hypothetical protein